MLTGSMKTLLVAASAVAAVGGGIAQARAPQATHQATTTTPSALTVTVTSARETSTRYRSVTIAGRISPTASLRGGAGSLILYRETRSGLIQLSFNGPQTRPRANGGFTMKSTGEPKGANTYVVQYVPSATGYAAQGIATEHITVTG